MALADIRHIYWLETIKLAIARGVASAFVITGTGLLFGFIPHQDFGQVAQFFLVWSIGSWIGALFYIYVLKALSALMGGIVTTVSTLLSYLIAFMTACGDPLIYLIIKRFPELIQIRDFKMFNMQVLIFIYDEAYLVGR